MVCRPLISLNFVVIGGQEDVISLLLVLASLWLGSLAWSCCRTLIDGGDLWAEQLDFLDTSVLE